MLSPCHACDQWRCVLGERKKDCLAPYVNLRRIGNSPGGFAASNESPEYWSQAEQQFYNSQLERKPIMAASKGRGRPAKATQAQQLLEALDFIAVGTREDESYQEYVTLMGGMATAFNGQIAAGHPIAEELTLCPQLAKLRVALAKSGKTLVISETPTGQLSVKGDKLRAVVPCVKYDDIPHIGPDDKVAPLGEIIKEAFKVCNILATEAGKRVVEASLLLEANTCTSTNGVAMLQYWHGIDLPPHIVLPKAFTAAVAKCAKPIDGFGFKWREGETSGEWIVGHFTVWFEGGAWIRVNCYQDRWPDVNPILNAPTQPSDTLAGLFEAIDSVHPFSDNDNIVLGDGKVMSHEHEDVGASYPVEGLIGGKKFNGKLMKVVAPYASKFDLVSDRHRAYFFGGTAENPVRGIILGIEAHIQASREPAGTIGGASIEGDDGGDDGEPSDEEINQGWGG